MKRVCAASLLVLLTACAPGQIRRLTPVPRATQAPAVCQIAAIVPGSPAAKAGLKVGDSVHKVNGAKPADVVGVSELIRESGPDALLEVSNAVGEPRQRHVVLNKDKPRLGASCDLTGWVRKGVSAAGNESVTVFGGPYSLTVSGVIDQGLVFLRARVTNGSDHPITVDGASFSAHDASPMALPVLSPPEVMYFLHGEEAISMVHSPVNSSMTVAADSVVRRVSPMHKKKYLWSQSEAGYAQANARYLSRESLWPTTLAVGGSTEGLIYFLPPKNLPFTVHARIEGHDLAARFGPPQPSSAQMSQDDLARYFQSQIKGTPIRLTLKNKKVFSGRFSSYDAINEVVWFDTPSGVLLTTSSFGLRHIAYAEAVSPQAGQTPPAVDLIN